MSVPTLKDALEFLATEVAPRAMELDGDAVALGEVLTRMGARGLGALKIPRELGGAGFDEADFRLWQRECARASGTFAFLQTQHQSAGSLIWKSASRELAQEILPAMAALERGIGIGFSQLRRPGPPLLTATPRGSSVVLNGHIPWITGLAFFSEVLVGATLPDGRSVFGLIPFETKPGLTYSEPMQLASMEAAQTVTAELVDFPVVPLFEKGADWILKNDQINIVLQGHFALGCARAGLDILQLASERKKLDFLPSAFADLHGELTQCETAMASFSAGFDEETTDERLRVRAWAIDLAFRCSQAAVISSSGAANSLGHPAQRIYREALVFAVSAQTADIMAASLDRLRR